MQKKTRRQHLNELRHILVALFPNCFSASGNPKPPLKIGIKEDLMAACPDLSKRKAKEFLADYCTGPNYWASIAIGGNRVDLDGNPAGIVEESHKKDAAEKFLKCSDYLQEKFWRPELDAKFKAA